jgi:hypothetical protein
LSPQFFALSGLNPSGLVHGEHEMILHRPLPPHGGAWTSAGRITAIYDKGQDKGALIVTQVDSSLAGQTVCTNVATYFARLDGGFGGDAGPKDSFVFPDRPPDYVEPDHPSLSQPLLYRLSGDAFALHVDRFARATAFARRHARPVHLLAAPAVLRSSTSSPRARAARALALFSRALPACRRARSGDSCGPRLLRTVNAETGSGARSRR